MESVEESDNQMIFKQGKDFASQAIMADILPQKAIAIFSTNKLNKS